MSRHVPRVCVDQEILTGNELVLDKSQSHHLARVMRARPGDDIILFTATPDNQFEYHAEIASLEHNRVRVRVDRQLDSDRESGIRVTLVQAIGKSSSMDYCLQKAVELGVTAIQPVQTQFSQVRLSQDRMKKKMRHWQAVILAAAEQAGRTCLPPLGNVMELDDWINTQTGGLSIVLHPESGQTLKEVSRQPDISLLIGPEGGFSDDELTACRAAGIEAVRLGPRILRTETAGIASLSAIQALWGDFC